MEEEFFACRRQQDAEYACVQVSLCLIPALSWGMLDAAAERTKAIG
jgi:hypothetical protein